MTNYELITQYADFTKPLTKEEIENINNISSNDFDLIIYKLFKEALDFERKDLQRTGRELVDNSSISL